MSTRNRLEMILNEILVFSEKHLSKKLDAVVLYGSYARGDYDSESDIDVLVRIHCAKEELNAFQNEYIRLASKLSLEYEVEVSITVLDVFTYNRYKRFLPYYENIESEGIKIA